MSVPKYEVGSPVLILFNPHVRGADGVPGVVVAGDGAGIHRGRELVYIRYRHPLSGEVHVHPFGAVNLSPKAEG